MATTIIPNYAERGPAADLDLQKVLDVLQELFAQTKGDEDKASTIEDANYYEGCAWGMEAALQYLTGLRLEIDRDGNTVEKKEG